jgi:hypothetical protein
VEVGAFIKPITFIRPTQMTKKNQPKTTPEEPQPPG